MVDTTITSAQRYSRLAELADEAMSSHRQVRHAMLQRYTGEMYDYQWDPGNIAGPKKRPLNMLFSVATILVPHLVTPTPAAYVTSRELDYRDFAEMLSESETDFYKDIRLGETLMRAVFDAIFGMGVVKTALGPSEEYEALAEHGNYLDDRGEPFSCAIDLDDYFIDPSARVQEEAYFEGHTYLMQREEALSSGIFDNRLLEDLPVAGQEQSRRQEQTRNLSGQEKQSREIMQQLQLVELRDVFLPKERMIVTLPAHMQYREVKGYLAETQYEGPEGSIYDLLRFYDVPGNVMPLPLVQVINDLDRLVNTLALKSGDQAINSKSVAVFNKAVSEDGAAIRDAKDGDVLGLTDADSVREVNIGGARPDLFQNIAFYQEQLSRLSGNTDLLGGLQADSDTLGQDRLLYGSADVRINFLRGRIATFSQRIAEKLAYWRWTDELLAYSAIQSIGGGFQVTREYPTGYREGDWMDYNWSINVYNKPIESPASQYRKLVDLLQNTILPLAQYSAQQGVQIDVSRLIEKVFDHAQIDGADEIIMTMPKQSTPSVSPGESEQMSGPDQRLKTNSGAIDPNVE